MNNYIIDPSVFYWINVFSIIQTVLALFGGIAIAGSICLAITYIYKTYGLRKPEEPDRNNRYDVDRYNRCMKEYEKEKEYIAAIRKWLAVTAVTGAVLCAISIFIPSKQTSVEMLVARTATFDNVNWTIDQVKEIVDYIIKALKGAV